MKLGYIIAIIAIASVLAMFIWGYLVPGAPSWIACIVGGLIMMIVMAVKSKDGDDR